MHPCPKSYQSNTPSRGATFAYGILAAFLAILFLVPQRAEAQFNRAADLNRRIEQAKALEQLRQYDRAVGLLERVLQEAPGNAAALNGVLRLYFKLEAFDKAIPLLETRIARSPDHIGHRARLAEALFGSGRNTEAEAQIQTLLDLHPQSSTAVHRVAFLYIDRQAYEEAIAIYLSARIRLEEPEAFAFNLASLYTYTLEIPGAVSEFVRWLTQKPNLQRVVNDRLDQLTSLGSQELVERALRAAVSVHSDSKDARDLLGNYYLRYGKPEEALAEYREADRLDGASGTYLLRFAEWARGEGHSRYAVDTYGELVSQAVPDTVRAEASIGLAMAYQEAGDMDQAASTYHETISQFPETGFREEAMFRLAGLHLAHYQNAGQALDLYRSLLEHAPATVFREQAMFAIAECHVVLGKLEDALAQYNRIEAPATASSEIRARKTYQLGELALFQGRLDDALDLFHETADRHTGSPYANDALEWTILIAEGRQDGDQPLIDYIRSVLLRRQFRNQEAQEACRKFLGEHAESLLADSVMLDIGWLLDQAGKPYQSVAALRDLIERHPNSRRVVTARRRIAETFETKLIDIPRAVAEYETLLVSHPNHFDNDAVRRKIRALTADQPPLP